MMDSVLRVQIGVTGVRFYIGLLCGSVGQNVPQMYLIRVSTTPGNPGNLLEICSVKFVETLLIEISVRIF